MQSWCGVLWRIIEGKQKEVLDIVTELDVTTHPIVPLLCNWLSDPQRSSVSPPVFPVPVAFDPRPPLAAVHPCFEALPTTDIDGNWEILVAHIPWLFHVATG